MRILFIFIIQFTLSQGLLGSYVFDLNHELQSIYNSILQLELEEAQTRLDLFESRQPNNLSKVHIENYIDFFQLFIFENIEEYKDRKRNKDLRLRRIEKGNANSPYYRFSQAEILLQWALVHLKFDDNTAAFFSINKAMGLLEENKELFPEFLPTYKSLGTLHALMGTIPEPYASILSYFTNLEGTIDQGLQELSYLFDHTSDQSSFLFWEESICIEAIIYSELLQNPSKAKSILKAARFDPSKSLLHSYVAAFIEHKAGSTNEAIFILERANDAYDFKKFPHLYFLLGEYKLNRLDSDAGEYLDAYIKSFQGRHYIKEAYQKLAWHQLIHSRDLEKYKYYMKFCITAGQSKTDEDKQAYLEAKQGTIPNADLLKARLLFDGGYYDKASQFLENEIDFKDLNENELLEFYYRNARVYQALDQKDLSFEYYDLTLKVPGFSSHHFRTNSYLQKGIMYEKQKALKQAKLNYEACLATNPSMYKSSLHQKAKAGIQRIQK